MAEAERVKPRSVYVDEAIQLALESRWSEALAVNRALLERHPPDADTYNRLGKALLELGQLQEALDAYAEAHRQDPFNRIAEKNTQKIQAMLASSERVEGAASAIDVELFTEVPGKSGLSMLSRPRERVSVKVAPGDVIDLEGDGPVLRARTARGVEIGEVETKLARRLLPLIATGNRYTAAVARVEDDRIEVMIREAYQSPENARKSSFPTVRGKRDDYRPYSKESLIAGRDADIEFLGDEDGEEAPVAEEGESGGEAGEEGEPAESLEIEEEPDLDLRPEDEY